MYYCTNMLQTQPHLYTKDEKVELMEVVFEQWTKVHSYVMVM